MSLATPSSSDIRRSLHQKETLGEESSLRSRDYINATTSAQEQATNELRRTIELLDDGGSGYLPTKKRSGLVRLYFENWNSLGVFTQKWKMDKLNATIQKLDLDIVTGCESQVDWRFVPPTRQFQQLLTPG